MKFIEDYISYVESKLVNLNLPAQPVNLYEPINYFLKLGGKRIRPVLTLLSTELFGGKKEDALNAAIAVELFHNFTLIHDDIMDESSLRRGKKTVHEEWDNNIAILSGDVLFVNSYKFLQKQKASDLSDLFFSFNSMAEKLCEGQQMDMDFEKCQVVDQESYLEMIKLKTSVLLGCALGMGAIIAEASKADRELIYDFGVNIGMAFQIQDDILDLYGDSELIGKRVGGDVINNKKTILNVSAFKLANSNQRDLLFKYSEIKDEELKVSSFKKIFDELNILNYCNKLRIEYYESAVNNLKSLSVNSENSKLSILAKELMNRKK